MGVYNLGCHVLMLRNLYLSIVFEVIAHLQSHEQVQKKNARPKNLSGDFSKSLTTLVWSYLEAYIK